MNRELKELEEKIGYRFQKFTLLRKAMIHSSYANEMHLPKYNCNERLEFLGDAVLELISSEFLFFDESRMQEGDLTKLRASMVCEPTLAFCARQLKLGEYLLLGKGEEATGGRLRDSVVSDAMEALIGAIYIDGGFASAKEFIMKFVLNDLDNRKLFYDSKTILQETVQGRGIGAMDYKLAGESGPDHDKKFEVELWIGGKKTSTGEGHTKKAAEQEAAYKALIKLHAAEAKRQQ